MRPPTIEALEARHTVTRLAAAATALIAALAIDASPGFGILSWSRDDGPSDRVEQP